MVNPAVEHNKLASVSTVSQDARYSHIKADNGDARDTIHKALQMV